MSENNNQEWDALSVRISDLLVAEGKLTGDQSEEAATLMRHRNTLVRQAAVLLDISPANQGDIAFGRDLATVPPANGAASGVDDLFVLKSPRSPRVADLRRVAQTLAMRWFFGETKRVALSIISADRREGRTAVATNLACIFAQSGVPTLLIDADLHNPVVHTKFDLAEPESDTNIHRGVNGVEHLSVVSAATLLELKNDRFMQSALHSLIRSMSDEFKVIFVDTAAAATSNDYQMAALATGGAMCVTRSGVTRARRSSRMLDLCEDAGIAMVGGVMLKA